MKAFVVGMIRYVMDIIRYNVVPEINIDDLDDLDDDDCFRLMLPRDDDDDDGNDDN